MVKMCIYRMLLELFCYAMLLNFFVAQVMLLLLNFTRGCRA